MLRKRSYFFESGKNPISKNVFGKKGEIAFMTFSTVDDAKRAAAKINDYTKTMNASYSKHGDDWNVEVEGMKAAELFRLVQKLGISPSRTYH